jgi:hypothetical protein
LNEEKNRAKGDGHLARRDEVHRRLRHACDEHPARQRIGDVRVTGRQREQNQRRKRWQILVAIRLSATKTVRKWRNVFTARKEVVRGAFFLEHDRRAIEHERRRQQNRPSYVADERKC